MSKIYHPIVIFSYNRPNKLIKLIKTIKKNTDYEKHKYYFFCDGKKKNFTLADEKKINENIKIISYFNEIEKKIIIRKKNYGLAKNIIDGVSAIIKKHNACIVLEDDLELSKNCLKFINFGLNKFKNDSSVGSISGYSYVNNEKILKNEKWFKLYRHCSWSWGTWQRVWNKIDWDLKRITEKNLSSNNVNKKYLLAGNDIPTLLLAQKYKIINSWAVRFNFNCLSNSLLSVSPRFSLTKNNGFGFGATHTLNIFKKQKIVFKNENFEKLNSFKEPKLSIGLNSIIKKNHPDNKKLKIKIISKKFVKLFF